MATSTSDRALTWKWFAGVLLALCVSSFGLHYRDMCLAMVKGEERDRDANCRLRELEKQRSADAEWRKAISKQLDQIMEELKKRP